MESDAEPKREPAEDALSLDPELLWDGDFAHYAWGQYRIWLSPGAAYQASDFVMQAVAQIIAGTGRWADDAEFRAFVSIAHEFVHYQQDLSTGCGHWDYLARGALVPEVLTAARDRSWFPETPLPIARTEAIASIDRYAARSLFNAYRRREPSALAAIRAELQATPAYTPRSEILYSLPRLFELDAIMTVDSLLSGLRPADQKSDEVSQANRHLYWPLSMPEQYRSTFAELFQTFRTILDLEGKTLDVNDVRGVLTTMRTFLPMLLDVAFAHPPPSYFTGGRADDRAHFEPGVRLIRALRAVHAAPVESMEEVYYDFARIVGETASYAYPSVRSIYEAWAEHFETTAANDPIASWRRDSCRTRLEEPDGLERRTLLHIVNGDVPVMFDSPAWPVGRMLLTRRMLTDDGALRLRMIEHQGDLQLAQWFLGSTPPGFSCPRIGVCSVSENGCRTGIQSLWMLPAASACWIRRMLEEVSFNLDRPLE